jgi:hypothetical protein
MNMARAKTSPAAEPQPAGPAPKPRQLRSKGPLGPSEADIVVYAGLAEGHLTGTPENLVIKTKAIMHLVTDRPAFASAIAHKHLVETNAEVALPDQMNRLNLAMRSLPATDREAAVAGSLELVDAALQDAFRILLFTDEAKPEVPDCFKGWKASKPDNRSTPAVITLTRD